MAHVLDAVIQLKDNFSNTLQAVEKGIGGFSKTARNMARDVNKVGKDLTKLGDNLTRKVTLPVIGAGVAVAKMSTDFNKEMAKVSTMIPGQTDRLYELKGAIQEVAIEVAKDTTEIAQGTYGVISAYGDSADTMEKVAINARAATAGVASTEDALNLSSSVMKGFGDTSAKANEKVMDLAFETLRLGQTSFPDMASAIGAVVPLTNELKISQEELFAVYATATGVTGNASEVSTQYKGALKSLMTPTKDMRKLMDKMGYADGQAMIEKEGYIGAMKTIVDTAKASNTPLQKYMGSIEGQTLALALAGELSDEYGNKLEQLKDSTGSMERAFKEQTEGINASGFSFEQSMIRMKVVAQEFGDVIAPVLSKGADMLSKFTESLRNLSPEQKEMIVKLLGIAAAVGPIILIVGKLTTGVAGAMFKFASFSRNVQKLGLTMKALVGPGAIVAGVIAALVVGGILLYKNWDKIKAKVDEVFPNIKDKIAQTMEHIKNIFTGIVDFLQITWSLIAPFFMVQWEIIKSVFVNGVALIGQVISNMIQVISGIVDFITGVFTGNWELAWQGVVNIFGGIFEGIVVLAKAPINAVISLINGALKGINKVKVPDWVPGLGGKGVNIPLIPPLAKGTMNWKGGIAQVHEKGGEIIDLPSGSRVYPHDKSIQMAREQGLIGKQNLIQNIVQNIIPSKVIEVKDTIQNIKQNLIPIEIPELKDIIQNIKQVIIPSRKKPLDLFNREVIDINKSKDETKASREDKQNLKRIEINIPKLADKIVIREDADIDKIASSIVRKIEKAGLNMA